jgi:hypothetical protein
MPTSMLRYHNASYRIFEISDMMMGGSIVLACFTVLAWDAGDAAVGSMHTSTCQAP